MPERWKRLGIYTALAGAILVGAWLRALPLDGSLQIDEFAVYTQASAPASHQVAHSSSLPLTLWANATLRITDSELGLRLPSFLAGCLAIALIYVLGAAAAGPLAGVSAAWLLALAPFHLQHSHHAGPAALLMLVALVWAGLIHAGVTHRFFAAFPALALSIPFGLLLNSAANHYITVFFLVGVFVALSVDKRKGGVARVRIAVTLLASVAVGYALLWFLLRMQESHGDPPAAFGILVYFQHLDDIFRPTRKPFVLLALYLLFGAIGAVSLLRRAPVVGTIVVGVFLLLPLMLSLFRSGSTDGPIAISMSLPLGMLAVGCGIAALAHAASRRFERGSPRRGVVVSGGVVLICVLLLAPSTIAGVSRHLLDHPREDWKRLQAHLTPMLEPGAVIYTIANDSEEAWAQGAILRDFYLPRMRPHGAALAPSLRELGGPLDALTLWELAAQFSDSPMWFIAMDEQADAAYLLHDHAHRYLRFGALQLWEFGAPTMNRFDQAGFENTAPDPDPATHAGVVEDGHAYEGARHLRVQSSELLETRALMPLVPALRVVTIPLRNAGFEVWRDGLPDGSLPDGWRPEGDATRFREGMHPEAESRALRIRSGEAPVRLVQRFGSQLAPGRDIAVRARAFAEAPDSLYIGVRYMREGAVERRHVAHPGNGRWLSLQLNATLPPDLDPASLAVEITRAANSEIPGELDDIEVEISGVEESLEPGQPHVLSLMLRHENLVSMLADHESHDAAALHLLFNTADGADGSVELHRFGGTRDWHPVHFQIEPGVTIPEGTRNLTLQVHLYGSGVVRVDNVQLEVRAVPTPFTASRRLPHDEHLVSLQPQPSARR